LFSVVAFKTNISQGSVVTLEVQYYKFSPDSNNEISLNLVSIRWS